MKITVIGCGRWGSLIAWYLDKIGHYVTLYGLAEAEQMKELIKYRRNNIISLSDTLTLSTDIMCAKDADVIVISINSQGLRGLMGEICEAGLADKTFVLCMKGIEISTGKRLSEVAKEFLGDDANIAVWVGPGHPQEFYAGIPNCMVIDSEKDELKKKLVDEFSSNLIRFYYGQDIIGSEIGAAAKNVIGIAAGMLDGLSMTTLKGALMSRGTKEVARLITACGGNGLSAYGLCHLGDYEATVFSKFSHNRMFGEKYIKGEKYTDLAEGYYTAAAIHNMAEKLGVDMPICNAIYNTLYLDKDPKSELDSLFNRNLKKEF